MNNLCFYNLYKIIYKWKVDFLLCTYVSLWISQEVHNVEENKTLKSSYICPKTNEDESMCARKTFTNSSQLLITSADSNPYKNWFALRFNAVAQYLPNFPFTPYIHPNKDMISLEIRTGSGLCWPYIFLCRALAWGGEPVMSEMINNAPL